MFVGSCFQRKSENWTHTGSSWWYLATCLMLPNSATKVFFIGPQHGILHSVWQLWVYPMLNISKDNKKRESCWPCTQLNCTRGYLYPGNSTQDPSIHTSHPLPNPTRTQRPTMLDCAQSMSKCCRRWNWDH